MTTCKLAIIASDGWALNLSPGSLPIILGRSPDCDIVIPDANVSRAHCGFEWCEGAFVLVDMGSANGTWTGNFRLPSNERVRLTQETILVFSSILLRVIPYYDGPVMPQAITVDGDEHGICLVDICDSTELRREVLDLATRELRNLLLGDQPEGILLIKNTGDGWLMVTANARHAYHAGLRTLAAAHAGTLPIDIRITLDAGPTWRSSTADRIGLVINHAARLEKTQSRDLDEITVDTAVFVPRNRLLLSESMRTALPEEHRQRCLLVGRRKLKGFGDTLHDIFLYQHRE